MLVTIFWMYRRTGLVIAVQESIVEIRSLFASCRVAASGGKLLIKTRTKISNGVGVFSLLTLRGAS